MYIYMYTDMHIICLVIVIIVMWSCLDTSIFGDPFREHLGLGIKVSVPDSGLWPPRILACHDPKA